jgi:hypothetical protein
MSGDEQLTLFDLDEVTAAVVTSLIKPEKKKYVYRVTQDWPNDRYKDYMFRRNKRTVPTATRQRVGSILAYQRQVPAEDRAVTTIERVEIIGDWEDCTSEFDVPQPSEE